MKRKQLKIIFALAAAIALLAAGASADTVIYYDKPGAGGEGVLLANMMMHLAGHFDPQVVVADVGAYQPGDMQQYQHAIYVGVLDHALPGAFLQDVASGVRPVLWLAGNIEQTNLYNPGGSVFGFTIDNYALGLGFNRIDYRDRRLVRRGDPGFFRVRATGEPTVWGTLSPADDPQTTNPYIICGAALCYVADQPLYYSVDDGRYLALVDFLHEYYQSGVAEKRYALIRLEDLAPKVTPVPELYALADRLAAEGIPFSFGVVPIFKDPEGIYFPPGSEFHFDDDPEFVAAIEYLLAMGGTMIMHGVTHQHDMGISRVDWEFVEGLNNQPLPYDSEQWVRDIIEYGLAEFAAQGWSPVIWETPHYAASHGDYTVFADYFSLYYEQPLVFPLPPDAAPVFAQQLYPQSQTTPYYTPTAPFGMGVIPETLGYLDPAVPYLTPPALLERADALSVVRDGVASFFAHVGLVSSESIFTVVSGLQERGYEFVSVPELIGPLPDDDDDTFDDDDDDTTDDDEDKTDPDLLGDDDDAIDDDDDNDDDHDGCGA